ALKIDSNDAITWNNKGNILLNMKEYEKALESYDKSLSIDPNCIEVWQNKGNLLKKLNRNEEALECFDKIIEINKKPK
ncbi:MAG: tetratricopeptide repeat protein, partial [Thermoplasmata archaeon]|nr:tetratricopeptide repeat protein [Thermoplasmata archaeon]